MRSYLVVMAPPIRDDDSGLDPVAKPFQTEALVTQFAIETFGGGEANVAVSLSNYGMETEFVTRLPKNDIADACIMELRKYNVGTRNILRGGDRVGIYFLETGAVARSSKVVYDRANSAIAEIQPDLS